MGRRPEIVVLWPRQKELKTPEYNTAIEAVHDELLPDQLRRLWRRELANFSTQP